MHTQTSQILAYKWYPYGQIYPLAKLFYVNYFKFGNSILPNIPSMQFVDSYPSFIPKPSATEGALSIAPI